MTLRATVNIMKIDVMALPFQNFDGVALDLEETQAEGKGASSAHLVRILSFQQCWHTTLLSIQWNMSLGFSKGS
jgi:hypothetical protein